MSIVPFYRKILRACLWTYTPAIGLKIRVISVPIAERIQDIVLVGPVAILRRLPKQQSTCDKETANEFKKKRKKQFLFKSKFTD